MDTIRALGRASLIGEAHPTSHGAATPVHRPAHIGDVSKHEQGLGTIS